MRIVKNSSSDRNGIQLRPNFDIILIDAVLLDYQMGFSTSGQGQTATHLAGWPTSLTRSRTSGNNPPLFESIYQDDNPDPSE